MIEVSPKSTVGFAGFSPISGEWTVRIIQERGYAREYGKWEYAWRFDERADVLEVAGRLARIALRRYRVRLIGATEITPTAYQIAACYLLHFDKPYKHAGHYLGVTIDMHRRLKNHRSKRTKKSSKLTLAAARAGIGFRIVCLWSGDYDTEKQLKARQSSYVHCGYCKARRDAQQKAYRARKRAARSATRVAA